MNNKSAAPQPDSKLPRILAGAILLFVILFLAVVAILTSATPLGGGIGSGLRWLFALDSVQLWWYVTRAAAIVAYMLMWLSTAWGLAVPSKILSPVLDAPYTFDFHEFISLLALGFAGLHIGVLMLDRYLPYSIGQILVPFLSPYRPVWVGIGVLSMYIMLLVTVTFYLRNKIGTKTFRSIHALSLLGYLGITLHGLYAGTDGVLTGMKVLYAVTGLVIVFLTVYWLTLKLMHKLEKKPHQTPPNLPQRQKAVTH